MDTMRRGDKEVQERVLLLQKEKDQLTVEYKDKRKKVDDMKEDLQKKITDYSKLAESGQCFLSCISFFITYLPSHYITMTHVQYILIIYFAWRFATN